MKEFDRIPVTKVQRATKFIKTGAKIGGNYLKHYGKRLLDPEMTRDELHENNAADIYSSLSELKGSALKVAQMLSMDRSLLPQAYQQKFAMAQYSAPPLSYPLVSKIFQQQFKKSPDQLFDTFTSKAVNAASMGQVHKATIADKAFAVKIQYPGIGETVQSDLAMVKPIALSMFSINPVEYAEFIKEVEQRLLEETDYDLELKRSVDLTGACAHIPGLKFPTYYPEFSGKKILTMDWIDGKPLGEYFGGKLSDEHSQRLGQAMWDFYHFQIHQLRQVHADPHPGNFLVTTDGLLGVIDFGCVKVIPDSFYDCYFQLLNRTILKDQEKLKKVFLDLRFIYPDDTAAEKKFFTDLFTELVELLSRPFAGKTFDFSDQEYFRTLYNYGEKLTGMKELRNSKKARGVKDALYINRTYFGLYSIMHELKVRVKVS
jgi:predicted unusual protein kinase regulating ubiquinone biosynthesis (AarF/ABC1/UbiB family)